MFASVHQNPLNQISDRIFVSTLLPLTEVRSAFRFRQKTSPVLCNLLKADFICHYLHKFAL